jgi:N-methylhydantoinase B
VNAKPIKRARAGVAGPRLRAQSVGRPGDGRGTADMEARSLTGDPIRLEVIRNALTATADEMGIALRRAAYSTNIKTRLDFSCAIFDPTARVIAQSFSQPVHLGSLAHFVPKIISGYGSERLGPGDAILCNDGHLGGVHLNDVCLAAPVFHNDSLVAYVATIAHQVDVGGGAPGSLGALAKDIFGEGIRIPPVLFLRDGEVVEDVFKLICQNIRSPKETGGDIRAQIAGVNVGTRRYLELVDHYGPHVMERTLVEILDYTERIVRDEIAKIPNGVYHAVDYMDDDGVSDEPIRVEVGVEVRDRDVVFDLTGSDLQRRCPLNATYAMTLSNCAYALRALIASDVAVNDGFYRAMKVIAPAGTVANAEPPAAIGGGWETAFRICETALQALGQAVPERMAAGSKGCMAQVAFGGVGRPHRSPYVFYEALGGGYGARATKDGIDGVQAHGQNTENAPIEETEANYPVRIDRYELIQDSEGAGRFRGGLGLRRDYRLESNAAFSTMGDRRKFAPWPLAGGSPGRLAKYILNPGAEAVEMPSKFSRDLPANTVFSYQTAGGGGYGDPFTRSPDLVLADVVAGKVSRERARTVYGVALTDEGGLDLAATAVFRSR